jgi:hypothetical protein
MSTGKRGNSSNKSPTNVVIVRPARLPNNVFSPKLCALCLPSRPIIGTPRRLSCPQGSSDVLRWQPLLRAATFRGPSPHPQGRCFFGHALRPVSGDRLLCPLLATRRRNTRVAKAVVVVARICHATSLLSSAMAASALLGSSGSAAAGSGAAAAGSGSFG